MSTSSKTLFAYLRLNGTVSSKDNYHSCFMLWITQLKEQGIPYVFVTECNTGKDIDELLYHVVLAHNCSTEQIVEFIAFWDYLLEGLKLPKDEKVELVFIDTDSFRQHKRFIKPFLDQDFSSVKKLF